MRLRPAKWGAHVFWNVKVALAAKPAFEARTHIGGMVRQFGLTSAEEKGGSDDEEKLQCFHRASLGVNWIEVDAGLHGVFG